MLRILQKILFLMISVSNFPVFSANKIEINHIERAFLEVKNHGELNPLVF